MAADFLAALDPEATAFTFQTFDDGPDKRPGLAGTLRGGLAECWPRLAERNGQGAGVFVTINATRGATRKAADVTRVRAVFADFDDAPPPLSASPLPPSLVVESSPGKAHWYWLLADELPLDEFAALQQAIAARLGSDPKVKDLPRVMRLPGTVHRKRPDRLHLVRLVEAHPPRRYTAEDLRAAFPPLVPRKAEPQALPPPAAPAPDDYAERALQSGVGAVATAPEGQRNDTLNREACGLFGLVKAGRLDRERVTHALRHAAAGAGLAEGEINATLQSAWEGARPREAGRPDGAPDGPAGQPGAAGFLVDGAPWAQPPISGTELRTTFPGIDERPRWACYLPPAPQGRRPGVWFHGIKHGRKGEPPQPVDEWLCSPLLIEATTRDVHGSNYGRLLCYYVEGQWKRWNMPMSLLGGDIAELRRELLRSGVLLANHNPRRLADYLSALQPRRKVRAALEVGWHGRAFVLPDRVHGAQDIFFQSETPMVAEFSRRGTLADWQQQVASLAVGNPPLAFVISAAFAAPLLQLAGMEGGGIHLLGISSCGKSTAQQAGVSVWGPPTLKRSWHGTHNGLEAAAAESNDLPLFLDELGECPPREVGRVVYALGNGTGKARANARGHARTVRRWRTLLISSGEKSLATVLAEAGERATAGQSVRLLSIPVEDFRWGSFDALHNHPDARHLADHLKAASATHYGTAGEAWLRWLTGEAAPDVGERLRELQDAFPASNGQQARAGRVFALIALGGELATEAGILPWPRGEALAAARELWQRWIAHHGQGPNELRQVVESLQGFIGRHADRVENLDLPGDERRAIYDRAGWKKGDSYYLLPAVFREAIQGVEEQLARRLLKEAGLLVPQGTHLTWRLRVGGSTIRTVRIREIILATDVSTGNTGNTGNTLEDSRGYGVPTTGEALGTLGTPAPPPEPAAAECSQCSHQWEGTGNTASDCFSRDVPSVPSVPTTNTATGDEHPDEAPATDADGGEVLL